MGLEIDYIDGQTLLDEEEKVSLRIKSISSRAELDEFEQQNIEKGIEWTMKRKFKKEEILTEKFIKNLHRKMYGNVWKWAGEFRRTEKSIGIDPVQIGVSLKQLCDDCLHWIKNTTYAEEEIAIRFKHSLVSIHCFANGNGRHSRLMADIIISHVFGKPFFSWGKSKSENNIDSRSIYLKSLRDADNGNIQPLLEFAKTSIAI